MSRPRDERARRERRSSARSAPPPARRHARWRTASRPRSTRRSGRTRATCSSGAGTRCRPRRTCGASCWTRAERARGCGRGPVPQPHRAGGRRAPAPAAGHRRRARDRDDARDRRRRPPRRGLVPRPRRRLRRAARGARRAPVEDCARDLRRRRRRRSPASGASSRPRGPALLRLGVGAQRHLGAPAAYATIASLPALTGAWRDRGGGCSYIPTRHRGGVSYAPLERDDLRPGPVRTINMSQLGEALTDPELDPPVKALVCWNSNPASIAPDQERVLEGLRREDLFTVVLEQFMTDTAAHADVVLPATTQLEHLDVLFSWGHHYLTWNEPAIEPRRRGEAEHRGLPAARRAPRARRPVLPRQRRASWSTRCSTDFAGGRTCASAAGEDRPRPGPGAARRGRLRHRDRARSTLHAALRAARPRWRDAALAERFPLALITPKTHLFLNSTFANQRRQHSAQPEPAVVVIIPADARARGIDDGAPVRVFNDRGVVRLRRARVRRRPPRRAGGADGLVERATTRTAAAPGHHARRRSPRRATRRPSTTTGRGRGALESR